LLTAITRGLAGAFPGVPLFSRGSDEVARLAEMAADDAAARASGRPTVVAALLAMGTGTAVPAAALAGLAAAAYAVPARVERMLRGPAPVRDAALGVALGAVLAMLAVLPVLLTALAG